MRENLFNIERSIFLEEVDNDGNHIFIVVLPDRVQPFF